MATPIRHFEPAQLTLISGTYPVRIRAMSSFRYPALALRSKTASASVLFFFAGFVILATLAAIPPRGDELPQHDPFNDRFFRAVFPTIIILLIAWYVASVSPAPERRFEHLFLKSLPLTRAEQHRTFMLSEGMRFQWVPPVFILTLLPLLPVSPVAFVVRLGVVSLLAFAALQLLGTVLHLAVAYSRKSGTFPTRLHPLLQMTSVAAFGVVPSACALFPERISSADYWIVCASLTGVIGLLLFSSRAAFAKWQDANVVLRFHSGSSARYAPNYRAASQRIRALIPFVKPNPLLNAHIALSSTMSTIASQLVRGLVFVAAAYLIAMNNEYLSDAVTILIYAVSIYAFVLVQGAKGDAPPEFLWALPIRSLHLYIAMLFPPLLRTLGVTSVLAILVKLAGASTKLAVSFALDAMAVSCVICSIGVGFSLRNYLSRRVGSLAFLVAVAVLALLIAVGYQYRALIAIAAIAITIAVTIRTPMYRT